MNAKKTESAPLEQASNASAATGEDKPNAEGIDTDAKQADDGPTGFEDPDDQDLSADELGTPGDAQGGQAQPVIDLEPLAALMEAGNKQIATILTGFVDEFKLPVPAKDGKPVTIEADFSPVVDALAVIQKQNAEIEKHLKYRTLNQRAEKIMYGDKAAGKALIVEANALFGW